MAFQLAWLAFHSTLGILQALLLGYHGFRFYYNYASKKSFLKHVLISLSYSYLILSVISRGPHIYANLAGSSGNISDATCALVQKSEIAIGGLMKFLLHIFVTARCYTYKETVYKKNVHAVFFFGCVLIMSDLLFIVYVVGVYDLQAEYGHYECNPTGEYRHLVIWYGMNDIIIGIYALAAFIYPLYKVGSDTSSSVTISRITKYNTLAILSTIITTILVALTSNSYVIALGFSTDYLFNGVCLIMQYSPLKYYKMKESDEDWYNFWRIVHFNYYEKLHTRLHHLNSIAVPTQVGTLTLSAFGRSNSSYATRSKSSNINVTQTASSSMDE